MKYEAPRAVLALAQGIARGSYDYSDSHKSFPIGAQVCNPRLFMRSHPSLRRGL